MISRRDLLKLSSAVAVAPPFSAFAGGLDPGDSIAPACRIEIAPLTLDLSHTRAMAMGDPTRARYGGRHGFLMEESSFNPRATLFHWDQQRHTDPGCMLRFDRA